MEGGVTGWTMVFLGIIAVSTLMMAALQVAIVIYAARAARRVEHVVTRIEQELQPLVNHLTTVGRDATRTVALVAAQAARMDAFVAEASAHVARTMAQIQTAVAGPTRHGLALMAGVRATVEAVLRPRGAPRADLVSVGGEEEALFIG